MLIYLVWDISGSMAEWGKLFIARSLARFIEQYVRLGYGRADLKLVAWGNEARVLNWHPDQEFPLELLVQHAAANAKALVSFFGTKPSGKILLLTDGFWAWEDARELERWKRALQPHTLRIIKIGADANPQLKGDDVFPAEDIFAALDSWLEGRAV